VFLPAEGPVAALRGCDVAVLSKYRDIDRVVAGKFDTTEPITQHLPLLQERWAGIIEVWWEISPSAAATLDLFPTVSQQVSSILEEGINNACSHGRARVVDISVRNTEDGNLQIQFVDDGQGPAESIEAGMGFREIETGGGSWQLDRLGASGARLMVTLPLRLSAASATGV
jgi:signal transduction histidine kinase